MACQNDSLPYYTYHVLASEDPICAAALPLGKDIKMTVRRLEYKIGASIKKVLLRTV